jgi:hypothetical protein
MAKKPTQPSRSERTGDSPTITDLQKKQAIRHFLFNWAGPIHAADAVLYNAADSEAKTSLLRCLKDQIRRVRPRVDRLKEAYLEELPEPPESMDSTDPDYVLAYYLTDSDGVPGSTQLKDLDGETLNRVWDEVTDLETGLNFYLNKARNYQRKNPIPMGPGKRRSLREVTKRAGSTPEGEAPSSGSTDTKGEG